MAAAKKAAKKGKAEAIEIPQPKFGMLKVVVVGDSPLVCHRWSEKQKKVLADKQQKKATGPRQAKDPEAEYKDSLYTLPGKKGYYFPTVAFKKAMVDACSFVSDLTKVAARGAFHVVGEYVQLEGKPVMREDIVVVANGNPDLRYRGEFKQWSAELCIRFFESFISAEQILNLLNTAGFAIGVGESRPQKNGSWGMFHVADRKESGR